MSDLLSQIYLYMSSTFIFGLLLGWLVWGFGAVRARQILATESEFWHNQLNEARRKQGEQVTAIKALQEEKSNLKKRISSMAS